jgi:hypothetical protein
MPVKIFYVEGNELIGRLESGINKWQKSLGSCDSYIYRHDRA